MTFPALQFPFNGLTDKIRSVLAFGQYGLDPVERPFGESGLHILGPHFLSSHANYFSYEVLTVSYTRYITHMRLRSKEPPMTAMERQIAETLAPLIAKAETGEQWAEICRLEAEMIEADRCMDCGGLVSGDGYTIDPDKCCFYCQP